MPSQVNPFYWSTERFHCIRPLRDNPHYPLNQTTTCFYFQVPNLKQFIDFFKVRSTTISGNSGKQLTWKAFNQRRPQEVTVPGQYHEFPSIKSLIFTFTLGSQVIKSFNL